MTYRGMDVYPKCFLIFHTRLMSAVRYTPRPFYQRELTGQEVEWVSDPSKQWKRAKSRTT